ncbi:MAG: DUF4783 domain-containing protein [Tannerella sp.]|nr:DUF4783 domain-containing protein [Tannerella sp.]
MFAFILSALSMQAVDIASVSKAFKEGKASAIAGNMNSEVDIAVPGTSKKGTGSEAIAVLDSFFRSCKPTGFTVAHHADKKETGFLVGKLATEKGEYRVNVTYYTKDNTFFIQSIRIE